MRPSKRLIQILEVHRDRLIVYKYLKGVTLSQLMIDHSVTRLEAIRIIAKSVVDDSDNITQGVH